MESIVRASAADCAEMVDLGNYCFARESGIIEQRWCHVWGGHLPEPSEEYLQNFFLSKDGQQIVGMIAIIPLTLSFCGRHVQAGGITAVATHPLCRGRGIMSTLLAWAEGEMRRRGDAVSVLGGDRSRYGRFGWEPVGSRCELHYPQRYLQALPDPVDKPVRIRASDGRNRAGIMRHYERRGYNLVRSEERLTVLIRRKGAEFWGIRGGGGLSSYLAALDSTICEYGGEATALPGLVKYFAGIHGFEQVTILTPPRFAEQEEVLYELAGSFGISSVLSLRILSLTKLVRGLLPVLQERSAGAASDFQLGLKLRETGESVCVRRAGDRIDLCERAGTAELSLDGRNMARVLFGPFAEGPIGGTRPGVSLGGILPVDLRVSKMDMV